MRHRSISIGVLLMLVLALTLSACAPAAAPTAAPQSGGQQQVLRLATTTSPADTHLLDYLLPDFPAKYNARVDVVAVGTGQAIALGAKGDADVLLVHARKSEDKFVAA